MACAMRQPIWGTQTLHPMQAAVLGPQQVLKDLDCITSRPHIEHRQALLENCNASVLSSRQCQSMSGCTCSSPTQERPSLRAQAHCLQNEGGQQADPGGIPPYAHTNQLMLFSCACFITTFVLPPPSVSQPLCPTPHPWLLVRSLK